MSAAFRRSITNAVAFSVPARAVKATGTRVHYEFLDGSTDRFPLPNFARKK